MKILMVCLGNICRSPLAEGIMKTKLGGDFFVDSAGTIDLHKGEHPDKRAVETAKNHGVDISKQYSRPITAQDLEDFDRIYCMDSKNLEDVISLAKNDEQRSKIALLMEAADLKPREVADPYFGGVEGFETVFKQIDAACESIAEKLSTLK
ncbi:protein tyrosine phosphatase [Chryseobacterium sp. Leaf180]|jgi:protein-tyrosine phosphatase|uniref:low molecular weight protein-tyrosine-phosphatase n=1 Tax=Chryseobacterium sp. Leaf180 TaxID=1736289 RepID=UPI0006F4340B|nr:low molecular weight protein-tyrosine-phosphatase [Chryseobacterium sp. Leaf180]KQR94906.1 protein tyrosine phosphatase [Chryseobacterium sp. Leaf180]